MKQKLAVSLLSATLVLTGCSGQSETKTNRNVAQQIVEKDFYEISTKFIVNDEEFSSLKQYKEQEERQITKEIAQFVEKDGFSEDGYNDKGYDRSGFNRNYVDADGFDRDGYMLTGVNRYSTNRNGRMMKFKPPYDAFGFDSKGYDQEGFDKFGFGRDGYNHDGFNALGESNIKGEKSMNDYSRRSWKGVSENELLMHDFYFAPLDKAMQESKKLRKDYERDSMHPWGRQAYNIHLLHQNSPVFFDDLLPMLKVELVSKWNVEHLTNHDEKYMFTTEDGLELTVLSDEKLLPPSLVDVWPTMSNMQVNDQIDIDDDEGYTATYTLKLKKKLSTTEQSYVDI
ncbi:MAG: hypothetical protein RR603_07395, partial [Kurthia sp.]